MSIKIRGTYFGNEVVLELNDPSTHRCVQQILVNEEDGITFETIVGGQVVHTQFYGHEVFRTFKLPKNRCKSKCGGIRCVLVDGHMKGGHPMHGAPIGTGYGEWGGTIPRRRTNGRKTPRSR